MTIDSEREESLPQPINTEAHHIHSKDATDYHQTISPRIINK